MLKFNPFTGNFDIVSQTTMYDNVDGGDSTTTPNKIQLKRDTKSNFQTNNPILNDGEIAIEKDTGKIKIGDGSSHYNDLNYFSGSYWSSNAW